MNNDLLFDFNLDKAAKTVYIVREFNAPQALVWDAFTKAELLDQWSAPAPMRAKTKYMDFSEQNGITKVSIAIFNESLKRLEKMIEMGFKEGITVNLNQLEKLLK